MKRGVFSITLLTATGKKEKKKMLRICKVAEVYIQDCILFWLVCPLLIENHTERGCHIESLG